MNLVDTLDRVFDFIDKPQNCRIICKFWKDVIDFKLRRCKYFESKWIKTHHKFMKLKNESRFISGKPKGSQKIEKIDYELGITYQIFSFYDKMTRKTISEFVCSDYLGTRLKLFLTISESWNPIYNIDKMEGTHDLLIQFGMIFLFDFKSFSIRQLQIRGDQVLSGEGKFFNQKKTIELICDKDVVSFEYPCSSALNSTHSTLELEKKDKNTYSVLRVLGCRPFSPYSPSHQPLMTTKLNNVHLILFDYYCLLFQYQPFKIVKIDLWEFIGSNSGYGDFFIGVCEQRQSFVVGWSKRTNKPSNVKKLFLKKIILL